MKHIALNACRGIIRILALFYIGFAYGDQMDRSPKAVLPEWLYKASGGKDNE